VTRRNMDDFIEGRTGRVECAVYDGPESVRPSDKVRSQERVACKTSDGRIWFPNAYGVMMVDPAHFTTNQMAPPVHIDRVLANGRELTGGKMLIASPGQGELECHFTALSFIASPAISFRYRLEGFDQAWVDAGGRRMAFYTNLKPGRYTLRVIAANADGIWNLQGDSVTIEFQPHFYQTLWFDLAYVGIVLALMAGLYAWRIRYLKLRHQALQKSRDLLEAEVVSRTADLARANESLQREESVLKQRTQALEGEIAERCRMQAEIERIHGELIETSREAGMAEVAAGVLHNVGNALNSVNISASLLADWAKQSKTASVARAAGLLQAHLPNLAEFLTHDPKGRRLPQYLVELGHRLAFEQSRAIGELTQLRDNVEHIKRIVAMQQNYATFAGVTTMVNVLDLVEDALHLDESGRTHHEVKIVRDYTEPLPEFTVDRHQVLQILINLLRNAQHACRDTPRLDKQVTVRVRNQNRAIQISVMDNGVGIPTENLTRIFNFGFTTWKGGHGFGLHNSANAARAMGGGLEVQSEGTGHGACFTLTLPLNNPESK